MDHNTCCNYVTSQTSIELDKSDSLERASARVPWSGSTLGLADLISLAPRGQSLVIGVLGDHDAGKTTFLLGNYLNCIRGLSLANAEFAGSWTLGAWESLAAWSRFDTALIKPGFPPHTPRGISRCPGLLHLAMRKTDGRLCDLLFTDAPGEWFQSWAINEDSTEAEGARWTVEYADVILVFADCERLNGPWRGDARRGIRQLIERLGKHVNNRPVALVWAKSDKALPEMLSEGIRGSILRALAEHIPNAFELTISVSDPSSLTAAMSEVLVRSWVPKYAKLIAEPVIFNQPYLAYRGAND